MRNRYRPKFKSIDPKSLLDVKFDLVSKRTDLFENKERKRELNANYELCTKLSTRMNQSLMTMINDTSQRGATRMPTRVPSPTNVQPDAIQDGQSPSNIKG